MNKIVISIILLFSATTIFGQNKINLQGLSLLQTIENERVSRGVVDNQDIEAIAIMKLGWDETGFQAYDAKIIDVISGDIIIVSVPADKVSKFAELDQVEYVEFGNTYQVMMDFARPASNVTPVQDGFEYENSAFSFAGKGVVTGLMDEGLDPNHVNFKDENGKSRVKAVYFFGTNAVSATTEAAIANVTTDNGSETHGTHVAGIMSGSYNGAGIFMKTASASSSYVTKVDEDIPYYGVAKQSDIVMCGGKLTNTNIIQGVKNVVEYAKAHGQQAVVNLSLGSNDGPHDGTDALSKSISNYGTQAIICISAGNEGEDDIALNHVFTTSKPSVKTFVKDNKFAGVDLWGNDSNPLKVAIGLYDTSKNKLTELGSITEANQAVNISNQTFNTYYSGSISLVSEVNVINKRFHVSIGGTATATRAGQNLAIIVEGSEGQNVWLYGYGTNATQFASNSVSGYTSGSTNGTINGLACGKNVIAVGAYTTRITWGKLGSTLAWKYTEDTYKVGEISPFSSYGPTFQGVQLPRVCAPGANIISSFSTYYVDNKNQSDQMTGVANVSSRNYYWGPLQGTSMSSPYAAGVCALWLEADPSLDLEGVLDIIDKTSVPYKTMDLGLGSNKDQTGLRWGAGKIDALAGIKEVIARKNSGIDNILADASEEWIMRPVGDKTYEVIVDGASDITATLYNMQGAVVTTAAGHAGVVTVDAIGAAGGVYILRVTAANMKPLSRKLTL